MPILAVRVLPDKVPHATRFLQTLLSPYFAEKGQEKPQITLMLWVRGKDQEESPRKGAASPHAGIFAVELPEDTDKETVKEIVRVLRRAPAIQYAEESGMPLDTKQVIPLHPVKSEEPERKRA